MYFKKVGKKMKKHFYVEYNYYGMISCGSFGGPGNNGYAFLQFETLEKLNAFLAENEFRDCTLVARRCKYADVVRNVGRGFRILRGVCVRADTRGNIDPVSFYKALAVSGAFDLK